MLNKTFKFRVLDGKTLGLIGSGEMLCETTRHFREAIEQTYSKVEPYVLI